MTNEDRAQRAQDALSAYCAVDGYDRSDSTDQEVIDEVVSDLLCDLLHLLDRPGIFNNSASHLEQLLGRGAGHHDAEVDGQAVYEEALAAEEQGHTTQAAKLYERSEEIRFSR